MTLEQLELELGFGRKFGFSRISPAKHGRALGGGGACECELTAPREGGPDGGGLVEEDELDELVLAPFG